MPSAAARSAPGSRRCRWSSSRPIPPARCTWAMGAAPPIGATVADLLAAAGFTVHREYYVNDAGRQMDILAASVWLRYLELAARQFTFPANGYKGDYVWDDRRQAACEQRGRAAGAARGRGVRATCRRTSPQGGDKEAHIDALIARAQRAARRRRLPLRASTLALNDHPRRHPRGPRRVRRGATRSWYLGALARRQAAPSTARSSACASHGHRLREGRRAVVPLHRLRRREGPRGGARERREDLLRLRHRLPHGQARARLRPLHRHLGRRPPRLCARACAPALAGHGRAGATRSKCCWCSSRSSTAAARRCRCPRAPASSSPCASCAGRSATTPRASSM